MKHSNIVNAFSVSIFLTLICQSSSGGIGGSGTGGGNICYLPEGPVLLDLADLENIPKIAGVKIQSNTNFERLGVQPVTLVQGPIASEINKIFDRLPHYGLEVARSIELSMIHLKAIAIPQKFELPVLADFSKSIRCNEQNTRAVIGFYHGFLVVSTASWNELDLLSQVGMMIHEAGRAVQILQKIPITDLELQNITAGLVSGDLDLVEKINFDVMNRINPQISQRKDEVLGIGEDYFKKGYIAATEWKRLQSIKRHELISELYVVRFLRSDLFLEELKIGDALANYNRALFAAESQITSSFRKMSFGESLSRSLTILAIEQEAARPRLEQSQQAQIEIQKFIQDAIKHFKK